jgi:hypothetical protein
MERRAKVNLGLKKKTPEEKLKLAQLLAKKLDNNLYFPPPHPPLVPAVVMANNMISAYKEFLSGNKEVKQVYKQREKQLDEMLINIANYIEYHAKGNAEIIKSTGLELKGRNEPIGKLAAPTQCRVRLTGNQGELLVKSKPVYGAKAYLIQITETPENSHSWRIIEGSTRARFIIKNLISGNKYYFRIAAIGGSGMSEWSDYAAKEAP